MTDFDVILVGRGESIRDFDWNAWPHLPFMAVSSGILAMPFEPEMWCCADAGGYHDQGHANDPRITKHVPHSGGGVADGRPAASWLGYPNVVFWTLCDCPVPLFEASPHVRAVARGITKGYNTILMAVQVAMQLGLRRILFAGVDFRASEAKGEDGKLYRLPADSGMAQMMGWWYRDLAVPLGAEWAVTSEVSTFSSFLPVVQHA